MTHKPRLLRTFTAVAVFVVFGFAAAQSPAGTFDDQPLPIIVPAGFQVELVAAPPLLQHPMMGCFDDRGRLFVAEAAGLNLRSPELDAQLPNSVLMLEDTDGDGVFDKSHVFADKLTNPNGVAWHDGALYVASPPHIWRFRDTDGDGQADERTPLVSGFRYSGIANSLHGPVLSPDGRLYWMQGIGGKGGDVRDKQGDLIVPQSWPGIFSCWPDGSDLRKHLNGGMDNPVEVAFTPTGQMLGTVNLIRSRPRNDAVVHWQWGGVYPRRDRIDSQLQFPRTGDLLPTTVDFGHVAVAGLLRYRSAQFGDEFRGHLFVCEFNPHRIRRVALQPQGATFRGEIHDFLYSTNTDTHFTDVIEDADGSLLVIDTGGWFRNGCPVSQVAKPNLKGAIYRISKVGAAKPNDARGLQIAWDELSNDALVEILNDDRFVVRDRAIASLARRGDAAISPLKKVLAEQASPQARCNAVWALCRIRTPQSQAACRLAAADADPRVREAAAHAAFVNLDHAAVEVLLRLLSDDNASVRREAAAALGILADVRSVPGLLQAVAANPDRQLEHAIIFALIETNRPDATAAGLGSPSAAVRRAALIALDQMPAGNLTREMVAPLLDTDDANLQQTALDVITRRPGWAAASLGLLKQWLNQHPIPPQRLSALRTALAALHQDAQIQSMVAEKLADQTTPLPTRTMLLDVIGGGESKDLPAGWKDQLAHSLDAKTVDEVQHAVTAVSSLRTHMFDGQLSGLAARENLPVSVRLAAAAVVAESEQRLDDALFQLLIGQFHDDVAPVDRLVAAEALAAAQLSHAQQQRVIDTLPAAGPLEFPTLLRVFAGSDDPEVGQQLISALQSAPALESLPASQFSKLLERYPASVQSAAKPLLARLNPNAAAHAQRLTELDAALTGGDASRGRDVFFGKRAACATCHRIHNEGGQVGPDLSTIGGSRTRRDLLESIVFPSLSFAQGYEAYHVETTSGKVISGVIARSSAEALYLRTADRMELRLPRGEIEDISVSDTSLMPQGLDRTLSTEELRDLTQFLSGLRE